MVRSPREPHLVANPVAAFYNTIGDRRKKTGAQRGKAAWERERNWRQGGNELHNLPSSFDGYQSTETKTFATTKHRGGGTRSTGLVIKLPPVEVLVHILAFLPKDVLYACACSCWTLALAARPVVEARVKYRLATVDKMEDESQKKKISSFQHAHKLIDGMNKQDVDEVRKLVTPPPLVNTLAEGVMLCIAGQKGATFADLKKNTPDTTELLRRIVSLDIARLPLGTLKRLNEIMQRPELSPSNVAKVCRAATCIRDWLEGVVVCGMALYEPWALDRERAREACERYLRTPKIAPPSPMVGVEAVVDAAGRKAADDLVTFDDFYTPVF